MLETRSHETGHPPDATSRTRSPVAHRPGRHRRQAASRVRRPIGAVPGNAGVAMSVSVAHVHRPCSPEARETSARNGPTSDYDNRTERLPTTPYEQRHHMNTAISDWTTSTFPNTGRLIAARGAGRRRGGAWRSVSRSTQRSPSPGPRRRPHTGHPSGSKDGSSCSECSPPSSATRAARSRVRRPPTSHKHTIDLPPRVDGPKHSAATPDLAACAPSPTAVTAVGRPPTSSAIGSGTITTPGSTTSLSENAAPDLSLVGRVRALESSPPGANIRLTSPAQKRRAGTQSGSTARRGMRPRSIEGYSRVLKSI